MNITRDVISDLWPLYAAGEATADTRAVVEEFLAADRDFARTLGARFDVPAREVSLPADHEARALARTRDLVNGGRWLRGARLVAITLTVLAVVRFVSDDAETFWVRVGVAAVAWLVYGAFLFRVRSRVLRTSAPPSGTE